MRPIVFLMKWPLRYLFLALWLLLAAGLAGAAQPQPPPQVLILNSYHQGEDWTDNEVAGIFSELRKGYPHLIPMVETLDTKRFPSPAHLDALKDVLARKYHGRTIDLIMALDNPALDLLVRHADSLFPGVPVVFAGINGYRPAMTAGREKVTGVIERQDVAGTLAMALSLQPGVSKVLAVHDYTVSGLAVRQETEAALAQFTGKVDIAYSADVPFSQLSEELKAMPKDGVVLILTYVTDKTGRTFTREESTRLITTLSPAPVYAMHETRLGFGIVGGLLLEGKEHGQQAAAMAARILQGADPGQMPAEVSRSRSILDYEGVLRFRIPEHLLPKEAQVINRPHSFWESHLAVLLPAGAIIVTMGLLLMVLVLVVKRLKRTQDILRDSEANYRFVVSSMEESLSVIDADGTILFSNQRAAQNMSGGRLPDLVGVNIRTLVPPDQGKQLVATYSSVIDSWQPLMQEIPVNLPEGERWFLNRLQPIKYGRTQTRSVLSISLDITERKQVESALRQSEERFTLAMQAASDGLFDWNLETGAVYYSPAWKQMLGYQDEELANDFSVWERLTDPEDVAHSWEILREFLAGSRERFEAEFRMRHKDGHWVEIFARATCVFDMSGQPVRVVGTHVDITERKQAEEYIRQRERFLRTVVETTADGFWVIDTTGKVTEVNEAYCAMSGFSSEELVGRHINEIDAMETFEQTGERIQRIMTTGRELFESRHTRKDGTSLPVEVSVTFLPEQGGQFVCFCRDLSERQQAEKALTESERNYRQLIETAADAIYLIAADGRVIRTNSAAVRMLGYTAIEITDLTIDRIDPNFVLETFLDYWQSIAEDTPQLFESTHLRKDGSLVPVEVCGAKFRDGDTIHYYGIARDITERKRMEEEQSRLQAQLVHAQKMEAIGTLAGGIAHDFNNILGAVIGYAEMAREDCPQGSALARDLDRVIEAGNRAASLVKQILAFSRQQESEQVVLNPGFIVKEVVKLLRPSLPSTITISQRINAKRSVLADPTQLHQVLMNLATNAFHAMEQTGGSLEIHVDDFDCTEADLAHRPGIPTGPFVRLSVADTGPGIPLEIRDRIFDPYFTTKEVGKGTGMGLAIVDGIVRGSGGFITCESELGKGTFFAIFLPACATEATATSEEVEEIATGSGHILLVDDEEILIEMGQSMLERIGYSVTTRTSSLEALTTFQKDPQRFDAVITDQTMPGMTGLDLARRLLQIRPELPIILCTGYSNLVNEAQAMAYGIKGFAMKPLTKKEVATLLRKVMKGTEPATEGLEPG